VWNITNGNNSSLTHTMTKTSATPYPTVTLAPETNAYTINLTVYDLAGNHANATHPLTVSTNATVRPIMSAANFTGPTTLTQGSSYTFWLNVSNSGGPKSVAHSVNVTWYLLPPSGSGSKKYISSTTVFYTYTKGVVNASSAVQGTYANLSVNKTIRAQITWTPSASGNFILYANITASNEFASNYHGGSNVASMTITIHVNPTTEALEYGGIGAAVVVAIVALIWWYRRPARKGGATKSASKTGLERGPRKADEDDKKTP
jgi:hypothetical protein